MSSKPIRFISDRRYRWMSNFYGGAPIQYNDELLFRTVEHGFQYFKTKDKSWQRKILKSTTPGDAKRNGRRCPMRSDWDAIKVDVMTELVEMKFRQHPNLAEKLLATGGRSIQEDAHWDSFWGTGKDGKGKNMMGRILSGIRRKLQSSQPPLPKGMGLFAKNRMKP